MRKIDLTGKRYGRLIIIKSAGKDKSGHITWKCLCRCGKIKTISSCNLRNGNSKSCGCLSGEMSSKRATIRNTTHGLYGILAHKSWSLMIQRCTNPKYHRFQDYGGRGIKVCQDWMIFENFFNDMGERPEGLTIERIDNDGNYEPSNCKWATLAEQNRNTSRVRLIKYNGLVKCVSEWARVLNIPKTTLLHRLNYYHPEKAFNM